MTTSPVLPLARKVEAVIDWLDVEFMTLGPHNGGKLKGKLGTSFVTPLNPGPGDYATRFIARFQDPGPLAQVIKTLRAAGVALEQGAFVRGIEVAFDLYPHDRAELAQLAAHLYKFAAKVADPENHRTFTGKDSSTYYIGNQGSKTIPADPVSQRIYAKATDGPDNSSGKQLPPEQHCARYEITLTGSGLPFSTLGEAAAFNFIELAPWFKWRRLKDGLDPLQLATISATKQIGSRRVVKLRVGGRREFDRRTMADTELNKRAHDALRSLTRRTRRGMRSLDFSEPKWIARRVEQGRFSDNCSSPPSPLHPQINARQDSLKALLADLAAAQGEVQDQGPFDEDEGYCLEQDKELMELAALLEGSLCRPSYFAH